MIEIDLCGALMTNSSAHFAIRYLDPNCSAEFVKWRLHPETLTRISEGLHSLTPTEFTLAGIKIIQDPGFARGQVRLEDRFGESVALIKNIGAPVEEHVENR